MHLQNICHQVSPVPTHPSQLRLVEDLGEFQMVFFLQHGLNEV